MAVTFPAHAKSPLSSLDAYFRDVGAAAPLTATEENTLGHRIQEGNSESRDHLIRSNLRLVVCIARRFRRSGIEMEDIIAEGNLGLIRAAEAFDPEMGTRFSTYAAFWIKQSISRLIVNNGAPIRLPTYMNSLMAKWQRAKAHLREVLKRRPTFEEISNYLNLSPKRRPIVRNAIRIYNAAPSPGTKNDGIDIASTLVDAGTCEPAQALGHQEDIGKVLKLVDSMDRREATILRLRFGLGGEEPLTLLEVGARLALTRERVRQIEKEALHKLAERLEN